MNQKEIIKLLKTLVPKSEKNLTLEEINSKINEIIKNNVDETKPPEEQTKPPVETKPVEQTKPVETEVNITKEQLEGLFKQENNKQLKTKSDDMNLFGEVKKGYGF